VLTQSTTKPKFKEHNKKVAIKSFLYRAPKVETPSVETEKAEVIKDEILKKQSSPEVKDKRPTKIDSIDKVVKPIAVVKNDTDRNKQQEPSLLPTPIEPLLPQQPPQSPKNKLDSFTQLQRLRSKLNRSAIAPIGNPYQSYQPPSIFNSNSKTVPHSVPLKDEENEREKNTKNMGAGIAITKGDNGGCEIKQDLSVYGLSEGSSIQKFRCGETKFDKGFREHMKKVKTKLGK
jgi:hypothetical protein